MNNKETQEQINFPVSIDPENEKINFINTTQSELESLPFHDLRLNQNKPIINNIKLSDMGSSLHKKSISYIFHTSFCGSTFLARLLGQTKNYFSIREPQILMDMANLIRINTKVKGSSQLSDEILIKLISSFAKVSLNRPHVIIKPTNASNNLINQLITLVPNCKALLLYTDLDSFLISILKKGEAGKSFVRKLYNVLALDNSPYAMTDFRKVNSFTDLQIACLVWAMQMYNYESILSLQNSQIVKVLNANEFLNNPQKGLIKIAGFFKSDIERTEIQRLEEEGVFSSHSKLKDQKFNSQIRQQENQKIMAKHQRTFDEIHEWLDKSLTLPKIPKQQYHLFMSANIKRIVT